MGSPIETKKLSKRYGAGGPLAVDEVSLTVTDGEIYALLGSNGSGKSTFVKMLVTLLAPSDGSAAIAGIDVLAEPEAVRDGIGVTLQDVGVDPVQTANELLVAQGRLTGLDRSQSAMTAERLLEVVGLSDQWDDKVRTLSGGQRGRLDIALSLVHEPTILFLDEPTTGLDPICRRDLWAEIRRLRGGGTTIFLTTQYLEEADQLADRIGILRHGQLIEEGTARELKERLGRQQVIVDVDDTTVAPQALVEYSLTVEGDQLTIDVDDAERDAARIVSGLAAHGIAVNSVRSVAPTLDDVFVELTDTQPNREVAT